MYKSQLCGKANYTILYKQDRNNGHKPYWGASTHCKICADDGTVIFEKGGEIILFNVDPKNPDDPKTIEDFLQQADTQYSFVFNNNNY